MPAHSENVGSSSPAIDALRRYFGFDGFRPGQEAIVEAVLQRRDVLAIMPTGAGKSLCYQLPALCLDGVTVVVSPLIALMKDQVDALERRGIAATCINSTLDAAEQGRRIRALVEGEYKLVYIAPERFRQRYFAEQLKRARIAFFAIDEAHCVSQWGHDFRPDYLKIGEALETLGSPPVSAFTATATPDVRRDIQASLRLREPAVFVSGFARPNLEFRLNPVGGKQEKLDRVHEIIRQHRTGIIYCSTRKRVEEVSEVLRGWRTSFCMYHAGMKDEERSLQQDRFMRREVDVAVATNAFGMGIDRADIRFVVHYEFPGSVEAYYQEAGRGGRDGLPALAELLFNFADKRTQEFFIEGSNPGLPFVRELWGHLRAAADAEHEVRQTIEGINEHLQARNGMKVSSGLKILTQAGYIERFDITGDRMRGTRLLQPKLSSRELKFDEAALEEKERRDRSRLKEMLDYAFARTCRQAYIRNYFGETESHACGVCDHCQSVAETALTLPDEAQTLVLQKLLSGVARMSERGGPEGWVARFGRQKVVEMLTGGESEDIQRLGLDQLSTYGLLRAEGTDFCQQLIDECLRIGLLRSTGGEYPKVTLTAAGEQVMRRQAQVRLAWPGKRKRPAERRAAGEKPRLRKKSADLVLLPEDPPTPETLGLYQQLKALRTEVAAGKPAYLVFSDKVLNALATRRPKTPEQALAIPGIGEQKVRLYLPRFLEAIREYRGP